MKFDLFEKREASYVSFFSHFESLKFGVELCYFK